MRGGYRAGSGRPPGSKTQKRHVRKDGTAGPDRTPLEFLLATMNDASLDVATRLRAAATAAPFVHAKPVEVVVGKKEQAQRDAMAVATGAWAGLLPDGDDPDATDWGNDLVVSPPPKPTINGP